MSSDHQWAVTCQIDGSVTVFPITALQPSRKVVASVSPILTLHVEEHPKSTASTSNASAAGTAAPAASDRVFVVRSDSFFQNEPPTPSKKKSAQSSATQRFPAEDRALFTARFNATNLPRNQHWIIVGGAGGIVLLFKPYLK